MFGSPQKAAKVMTDSQSVFPEESYHGKAVMVFREFGLSGILRTPDLCDLLH